MASRRTEPRISVLVQVNLLKAKLIHMRLARKVEELVVNLAETVLTTVLAIPPPRVVSILMTFYDDRF